MRYKKKTRTKGDYKPEFAGLQLPQHPVNRYKRIFTKRYQRLIKGNSTNTPQTNRKIDNCCFACLIKGGATPKGELPNRIIWEKKADARWLIARWIWDFGFVLPAGLSDYGVGISPPIEDYIANKKVLFPSLSLPYDLVSNGENKVALEFEQHNIWLKENLHFAKLQVFFGTWPKPEFAGELAAVIFGEFAFLLIGRQTTSLTFLIVNLPISYELDGIVSMDNFTIDEEDQVCFNIGSQLVQL